MCLDADCCVRISAPLAAEDRIGADLGERADAVVEPEGGVVKAGRLRLMQLRVDGADEPLVLGRALRLDPVANDDLLHCETSLIRSVVVLAGVALHSAHASASSAGTARSMPVA